MNCKTCIKEVSRLIKNECVSCYNNTYQKKRRAQNKIKIELTWEQSQILTGLMLGDGCIQYSHGETGKSNPRLTIVRSINDKGYMYWFYDKANNLCNSKPFEYKVFDKRTNKTYKSIRLYSKSLESLKALRENWYPNGIKIVPKDLELTPLVLLVWFCDDGSFILRKKSCEIKLSTHGFSKEDVVFLSELLSQKFKSHFRVQMDNNNYYIAGSGKSAVAFIKEIDPIFPQCMNRKKKWNSLLLNKKFESSRVEKHNRFNYQISKSIINNNHNSFTSMDLANQYNWFRSNGKPSASINNYLNYFEDNKLLSKIEYALGKNAGRKFIFSVTDLGKYQFLNILNDSKRYLDGYGLV